MSDTAFVVRLPGRHMFLRWDDKGFDGMGFVERESGGGFERITRTPGPALGRIETYPTREAAEAVLARCLADGRMCGLVERCVVEEAGHE